MKYDLVDTIESGIIDYFIRNEVKAFDVPLNILELSIHINDYLNIKLNEN